MKVKAVIEENMKKHEIMPPDSENDNIWAGFEGDPSDYNEPSLRVKASSLAESGKVHMQFTCGDVAGLHEDMKEYLGTPYIQLGDNALRGYGISFNLAVKNQSIDESNLKALGLSIMSEDMMVKSLASESEDYAIMRFKGVIDGQDNEGNDVKMLDFRVGAEKNRMLIAFSQIHSCVKTSMMNYPEMKGEWVLAWLCSRYWGDVEATQEEE
tara:strand:- start:879 stop:1511 length:633 start_codon:yes stop_codon:yes gene_type:complete